MSTADISDRPKPRALAPGELVDGRYRIVKELGRGGMGLVHLATDIYLDRQVALKFARVDVPWATQRFQREAAALAAIRHDHVVGVHAYGIHEDVPFFVMEFVAGENLAHLVSMHARNREYVPFFRGVELLYRIAQGLSAAHAAGVIHSDIKTENVVIERGTGRPVLVDFGLAVDTDLAVRRKPNPDEPMLGTPHYMAPELYWQDGVTPNAQTDVYALAVVGYEVLTGRPPFDAPDALSVLALQRDVTPRLPSERRPELAPLDGLLMRALEKRPDARPRTAAMFASQLGSLVERLRHRTELIDAATRPSPDAIRIMVIEDEALFARLATRAAEIAFRGQLVSVTRAPTGSDALRQASEAVPHLVILDYGLPELNGVDVLSQIRAMSGGEETEVLVLSGLAGDAERWRFGLLGATDFLSKPIEFATLVERISAIAARRGWTSRSILPPAVSMDI